MELKEKIAKARGTASTQTDLRESGSVCVSVNCSYSISVFFLSLFSQCCTGLCSPDPRVREGVSVDCVGRECKLSGVDE